MSEITTTEANAARDTLESLVDRHDLETVLEMLAEVCGGKADHLRSNWRDEPAAKEWDRAAKVCDSASAKANKLIL